MLMIATIAMMRSVSALGENPVWMPLAPMMMSIMRRMSGAAMTIEM